MKKGQRGRILEDLLKGLEINWMNNISRYGTSARSRIAELRAIGLPIEDRVEASPYGARYKIYFLQDAFLKQYRSEKESA